ncbi:MAG: hypothetical protein GF383_04780, partial [Candidatus Lokiarchaeota archaeon]|nr:hypothetical protein [Candidatus Lokiarchaeota archaeon]
LKELIKSDPYFFDPYLTLAEIYKAEGNFSSARNLIKKGYQMAVKRIVNHKGDFPEKLEWGWVENRHLIRIIEAWAYILWNDGKNNKALEIFMKLLKSNPNDNIGARYSILAIRMGLDSNYEMEFASSIEGFIDAFKIANWFQQNAPQFPEEFDWWFKLQEEF